MILRLKWYKYFYLNMIGDIGIRGLSDLRWIRPGTVLQLEQFL